MGAQGAYPPKLAVFGPGRELGAAAGAGDAALAAALEARLRLEAALAPAGSAWAGDWRVCRARGRALRIVEHICWKCWQATTTCEPPSLQRQSPFERGAARQVGVGLPRALRPGPLGLAAVALAAAPRLHGARPFCRFRRPLRVPEPAELRSAGTSPLRVPEPRLVPPPGWPGVDGFASAAECAAIIAVGLG
jgi:hypothetical protein